MSIIEDTQAYESWLGTQCKVARPGGWLHDSARAAREATEKDFEVWRRKAG
jgi:hypothetical protein